MENTAQQEQQPTSPSTKQPVTVGTLVNYFKKNKIITLAIIAILFLILGSILFNVLIRKMVKTNPSATKDQADKQLSGSVLLSPTNIIGTPGQQSTVDVLLNTGGRKVMGVVVAIEYNPKLIEAVTLTPFQDKTSALGYSLEQRNEIIDDKANGKLILTLKLQNGVPDLAGTAKIADLSFKVKPLKVAIASTNISVTQLTGFLSSTEGQHTKVTKNRLTVTLPAGIPFLSPTPIIK